MLLLSFNEEERTCLVVARIKKLQSIYLQCRCAVNPLGPCIACDWARLIYIPEFVEAACGKQWSSWLGELMLPRQYQKGICGELASELGCTDFPHHIRIMRQRGKSLGRESDRLDKLGNHGDPEHSYFYIHYYPVCASQCWPQPEAMPHWQFISRLHQWKVDMGSIEEEDGEWQIDLIREMDLQLYVFLEAEEIFLDYEIC